MIMGSVADATWTLRLTEFPFQEASWGAIGLCRYIYIYTYLHIGFRISQGRKNEDHSSLGSILGPAAYGTPRRSLGFPCL